jgi:hypothetical protein
MNFKLKQLASFGKSNYENIQNTILLLTLFFAIILGFQQNQINERLKDLNDFVGIVALPGQDGTIKLINVGKINLYIYGYKNNLATSTNFFVKPRLISTGTLESSYFWIYAKDVSTPLDEEGFFNFNAYLQDEYGKKYVAEFGGRIEIQSGQSEVKLLVWSYKTHQQKWNGSAPKDLNKLWTRQNNSY